MKLENTSTEFHSVDESSKKRASENSDFTEENNAIHNQQASPSSELEDHESWKIVLYYCYIDMGQQAVDEHVGFHRDLCERNSLMGRIRVSTEGINGVLSGRLEACHEYEDRLREALIRLDLRGGNEEPGDWELDVKYCSLRKDLPVDTQLFDSLIVKATNSVVSLFEPSISSDSNGIDANGKKKQGYSKQTNRRRRRQQQRRELQQEKLLLDNNLRQLASQVASFPGAQHLSPEEWDQKLLEAQDAVLLDCRNVYESNVGYFQAPSPAQASTILTNTRKYSDLPKILVQSKDQWAHKKQIFMYCTGGVRCEQASKFVQALVADECEAKAGSKGKDQDVEVFQLHGGIQRYLEHHFQGSQMEGRQDLQGASGEDSATEEQTPDVQPPQDKGTCLYRGLNFVFDPRRTDPMVDSTTCVGKCCLCGTQHDDYDNGHAPVENQEARCCKCRILLLVCNRCRKGVQCWGEPEQEGLPKLFCGIDVCSDYQATGKNPVSIVNVGEEADA